MSGGGRIVLHVGAPKTGSTSLQRRLRLDPGRLRAHGLHVPALPRVAAMAGNAKLLSTALAGSATPIFRHTFPDIDVAALSPAAIVSELLADWRPERERLLLSSEDFEPRQAPELRRLLPRSAEVSVVMVVRPQDAWVESYYKQMVKTAECDAPISDFIAASSADRAGRFSWPDWLGRYETWREVFPDTQVILFEDCKRDLLGGFFGALGLAPPADLPELPPQNEALDNRQIAYLLRGVRGGSTAAFFRRRAAAAETAARFGACASPSLLSPSDRDRLAALFAADNCRLLQLLGRAPDDPALRLAPRNQPHTTLDGIYDSEAYRRYEAAADRLLAQRAEPV